MTREGIHFPFRSAQRGDPFQIGADPKKPSAAAGDGGSQSSQGSAMNLRSCNVGPSMVRALAHIQQLHRFGCSLNLAMTFGSCQQGHVKSLQC